MPFSALIQLLQRVTLARSYRSSFGGEDDLRQKKPPGAYGPGRLYYYTNRQSSGVCDPNSEVVLCRFSLPECAGGQPYLDEYPIQRL